MPMTVISVWRKRRAHAPVALGFDDAHRAGLGHGEVGAADGDRRGEEHLAQVDARGLGQLGRVVAEPRVAGQRALEQLADLGSVAVDGGHEDVRGGVAGELVDELGQIGLDAR